MDRFLPGPIRGPLDFEIQPLDVLRYKIRGEMRIAKGHVDGGVSKNFLKRDNVSALDDEIAREGVAKVVHFDLPYSGPLRRIPHLRPQD
jgi:hypothetical protein